MSSSTSVESMSVGTPSLCMGNEIIYKGFKRRYLETNAYVVVLQATCWFPAGQMRIFFQIVSQTDYTLQQELTAPHFDHIDTYYEASFISGLGFPSVNDSVVIEDANGKHTVELLVLDFAGSKS